MAILTAIFGILSRKLGDLLQALVGWSVMAMFGKLSSAKQVQVSVALVLSLMWPIFVVGVFAPKAAAFVIAFVPASDSFNPQILRAVWVALALVTPVIVGLLTRLAAPQLKKKGFFSAVLNGYPLAIGFAGSFLITLIVVPFTKVSAVMKGWSDDHVFVQTRKGMYLETLREVCNACTFAGFRPRAAPVPRSMGLATRVLKFFARGAIDTLVIEHPLMVVAQNLTLFLYPGDLFLRGGQAEIARVRALLGQTMIERYAYLVRNAEAQELQDDLGRLWEAVSRHQNPKELGATARSRLKHIVKDSAKIELNFEEWVVLDRIARRIENAMLGNKSLVDEASLSDAISPAEQQQEFTMPENVTLPRPERPIDQASLLELLERGLKDANTLVKLEVEVAKAEAAQQLKDAAKAFIGFGVALALLVVAFALGGVAVVFAIEATAVTALLVGGAALVLAAVCAGVGYSMLPTKPLQRTRKHLAGDVKQLKEHFA